MKSKIPRKTKGFTIIEVVLVLAIAGLIFLIVFLALPQLQRSRRDTQRKNDTGRALSALETYAGNHNGAYPTAAATGTGSFGGDLVPNYLTNAGSSFNDPSTGSTYSFTYGATALGTASGSMRYGVGYECDSSGNYTAVSGSNRNVAVEVRLESGTYCQDNQ